MPGLSPNALKQLLAVSRLRLLYQRSPAGIVSGLFAVFLIFLLLLETDGVAVAKAWTAYMLSVLGLRGWLWYAFNKQSLENRNLRRWEWAYALAVLLMGLGWGWLSGPGFPENSDFGGYVIVLMAVAVSFAGTVFVGLSCGAFWLMTLPTLVPAMWRFLNDFGRYSPYAWLLCGGCLAMVAVVQIVHRKTMVENLRRRIESETLLAEQQAIFESTTLGIAVIQDRAVVKANQRLGELLGRRLGDLQTMPLVEHFASPDEMDKLLAESKLVFQQGRPYHGAYRMRRADGSQFWAEISGRAMEGNGTSRSVWLIGEAPIRSAQ